MAIIMGNFECITARDNEKFEQSYFFICASEQLKAGEF